MKQEKCWTVHFYDVETEWRFSTKELAEKAIKFFEAEEDDYVLYEENLLDDEELLRKIAREENENA